MNACQYAGAHWPIGWVMLNRFDHPAPKHVGVQTISQRDGRRGDARLKANCHDLAFEVLAVACAAPAGHGHLEFWSVHVST